MLIFHWQRIWTEVLFFLFASKISEIFTNRCHWHGGLKDIGLSISLWYKSKVSRGFQYFILFKKMLTKVKNEYKSTCTSCWLLNSFAHYAIITKNTLTTKASILQKGCLLVIWLYSLQSQIWGMTKYGFHSTYITVLKWVHYKAQDKWKHFPLHEFLLNITALNPYMHALTQSNREKERNQIN